VEYTTPTFRFVGDAQALVLGISGNKTVDSGMSGVNTTTGLDVIGLDD
jgi:hypothetical protein